MKSNVARGIAFLAVVALAACDAKDDCSVGMEGCPCSEMGTCLQGLRCLSNLCVNPGSGAGGTAGSAGTSSGFDLARCLSCGEVACASEAAACSGGCAEVLDCALRCGTDSNCLAGCDGSGLTADDVAAQQAYASCLANQCASDCVASAGVGGAGSGIGGASSGIGGGGYDRACVQGALAASCAVTACHTPDPAFGLSAAAGLDLSSPTVNTDIINRPATYEDVVTNLQLCPTSAPELIIDTTNPARSLLLTKLTGGHACGDPMPSAMVVITDQHRRCLIDWATYLANGP